VLFRKGGHRDHSFHPQTAQCIDGKSHEELCLLFNEASKLYSYDPYTAYTVFAAICGCIPIVIPIDGVSEEQWHPNLADRYGVAYGEDRVSFAIETRDLLLTELEKRERDTDQGLEDFLKVVLNNFFRGRETH
jgi:hypothetical protein